MKTLTRFFVILIALGICAAGNVFAEEGGILKISALEGKALVKKVGTEDWIEAKVGDLLSKGDAIKTSDVGSVYLEISPDVGFTLEPNSEFVVSNTIMEPPIPEPYSEPARESMESVVAPEVNQEGSASGY